jgi:hypothetical protein
MIEEFARPRAARQDRWRRWWLGFFVVVMVVATGFMLGRGWEASALSTEPSAVPSASPAGSRAPLLESAAVAPPRRPPPTENVTTTLSPSVLQLPGAVPARGSGSFTYASGRGPVLGTKGLLRRFRVAVERGSGADPAEFAAQVEAILGDPRSWVGGGALRLQRVGGADPADFTVHLATRDTTAAMCARGGTNIRIGGRPYTSCRTVGKAIINLDRWRLSAKPYLAAKVPLASYRQYVINHEVGHELGHRHQGCPKAGGPAPVMVQQTLTVRGCKPYPWPRRGKGLLSGPSM